MSSPLRTLFALTSMIAPAAGISSGCGEDEPAPRSPDPAEKWAAALDAAQRKWGAAGLKDYDMLVEHWSVIAGTEDLVHVRDGIVSSVIRYPSSISPIVIPEDEYEEHFTVEGIFRIVQAALDRQAFDVDVVYDEEYGYPIRTSLDFIEQAVDDEDSYYVNELTPQ